MKNLLEPDPTCEHTYLLAGVNAFGLRVFQCEDCPGVRYGDHPATGLEQQYCCRVYGAGCACPCHADDFAPYTPSLSRS